MECVAEYIRKRDMTLERFGARVGATKAHVHKIIAGQKRPSVALIRRMHERCGISLKRLVYECTDGQ